MVAVGIQGSGASTSLSREHHDVAASSCFARRALRSLPPVVALRGLALPTCSSNGSSWHVNARLERGNGCLSSSRCPSETHPSRVRYDDRFPLRLLPSTTTPTPTQPCGCALSEDDYTDQSQVGMCCYYQRCPFWLIQFRFCSIPWSLTLVGDSKYLHMMHAAIIEEPRNQ